MPEIVRDEYISAGYFLIRKSQRPTWLDEPVGLVPDELISLEDEFCPKFNLSWGWNPGNKEAALEFRIDETKWDAYKRWCNQYHGYGIEVWSMFQSMALIRELIRQFIPEPQRDGLIIVGVGLHKSCLDDWNELYGTEGVEKRILQRLSMEPGGQVLGFDVSSYAHHNFDHTWFSHGHHRGAFEELKIRPGNYGLLTTRDDATRVKEYADAHDSYDYEYWLLVSYPLETC